MRRLASALVRPARRRHGTQRVRDRAGRERVALRRLPHRVAALAVAAGVLGLLLAPLGVVPAPTARGASTDLTVVTNARYTVQPDQKRVRVVVDVTDREPSRGHAR